MVVSRRRRSDLPPASLPENLLEKLSFISCTNGWNRCVVFFTRIGV